MALQGCLQAAETNRATLPGFTRAEEKFPVYSFRLMTIAGKYGRSELRH